MSGKEEVAVQGRLNGDRDPVETQEWLESLADVLHRAGPDRVTQLLEYLDNYAHQRGVKIPFTANTPYINTIPLHEQAHFPGNREIERRIKSYVRWNAMAMVVRANKVLDGIGGHISTYASAATLWEVAFNHFFKAPNGDDSGDQIFFQGHASPGVYARAYLEGRLTEDHLKNFRRELQDHPGLSSYPHPWLMPNFWQFPTVSMGLGPITAIYQARFNEYLKDRGLKDTANSKVYCFVGDGETDEPETLGAITLAARERLDNLIFVINCNLQRLDGPVRGNSQIVQELERIFRGAGWNVIKVLWGSDWDPLFAADKTGLLSRRFAEMVDGEAQKLSTENGAYVRKHFFGKYPELLKLVENMSDSQLERLNRGGHDPEKVYAAFKRANESNGRPTVILAHTIKGYGLGEAGEGKNISHQQKKLNEEELRQFRSRFGIPISDEDVAKMPFFKPAEDSPEMKYLHERRKALGGYVPTRASRAQPLPPIEGKFWDEFKEGTQGREVSTTMATVRMLSKLVKDDKIGKYVVPIVPDEARTFGMEAMFRQCGIYSHIGQLYEPVDASSLLYYKEAQDGQILEEGITEAGAMSSFIAAGTAYSTHGINTIPFFIYYSMFGMQRVGDMVWLAGDIRAKGFMLGGTAGRTTLNGEGLQHEDGNSPLLAYTVPNLMVYDAAFAYEIAIILADGIQRMYVDQEDIFYYLTIYNENYAQPEMPKGVEEGILKGIYKFQGSKKKGDKPRVSLMGSGPIMNYVLKAAERLEKEYDCAVDIFGVTSYKRLYFDQMDTDRHNLLNPNKKPAKAYVAEVLGDKADVVVAASDYVKTLPESIARSVPGRFKVLGTDGFGRSESRQALRDFFEIDDRYITVAALNGLMEEGKISAAKVAKAIKDLGINPDKRVPYKS